MIFYKKITICNLFAYYGEQSVEFSKNDNKPLYLIYGRNGYGKTSFIRSLKLLFLGSGLLNYGNVPANLLNFVERGRGKFTSNTFLKGSGGDSKWLGALNEKAVKESENKFFVELILQKDDNEIIIKRSWKLFPNLKEKLEIKFGDRIYEDNEASEQLEQILPSEFIEFFIFDGEEIEILAENIGSQLKEKIQSILNITILDKLLYQIKAKERDFREQNMKNSEDRAKLIGLESALGSNKDLLKSKCDYISDLSSEQKDLEYELEEKRNKRDINIENNAKELGRLQNEKKNIEIIMQDCKEKIRNFGGEILFLGLDEFLADLLKDIENSANVANLDMEKLEKLCEFSANYLYEKCDTKESDKSLFLKLHEAFKEFTTQNGGNEEYKNIKNLAFLNGIYNGVQTNLSLISENILKIKEARVDLETYDSLIRQSNFIDDDIKKELEKIKSELDGLESEIFNYKENIKNQKNEISELEKKINDSEIEIRILTEKIGRDDRIKRQLDIIKELEITIKQYKEKRIERVTKQLKEQIYSNYKRLLPNDNVTSVEIENFAVYLKNEYGENIAISNQSAGQKQIVAISIFWALSELSDRKLPLIIDTPLARMDRINKGKIIENYYFNASNQIIVLPHDGEFRQEEYEIAKDKIAGVYEIKNSHARNNAVIEQGDIKVILGEQNG